nr:zinc finger protein 6-like [Ipomoea batatas]
MSDSSSSLEERMFIGASPVPRHWEATRTRIRGNASMCSVVPLGYAVAAGAAGFHIGGSPVAVTADFQASDDGPENFATSSEVDGGVGIDLHLRLAPP